MANKPVIQSYGSSHCKMRLFIAGDAPNSRMARQNLKHLQERFPAYTFDVEIVDVSENPQQALAHGIYVTPALQVIEPGPGTLIFGNLSNHDALKNLFPEDVS